jgi:hypothetical protein
MAQSERPDWHSLAACGGVNEFGDQVKSNSNESRREIRSKARRLALLCRSCKMVERCIEEACETPGYRQCFTSTRIPFLGGPNGSQNPFNGAGQVPRAIGVVISEHGFKHSKRGRISRSSIAS